MIFLIIYIISASICMWWLYKGIESNLYFSMLKMALKQIAGKWYNRLSIILCILPVINTLCAIGIIRQFIIERTSKLSLMEAVKLANSKIQKRKEVRLKAGKQIFKDNDEFIKYITKFHNRINDDEKKNCTVAFFINLCKLDLQYGFMGGAIINKNGPTTIKIDG